MEPIVFNPNTQHQEDADGDDMLVERAKNGDREAFGELVRRHRAKVYGYARSNTHEPYLAEDIVQDALIRAFLHLGTLVDSRRFLPWLHRIVRNQAYTRLKQGAQNRERVFSGLTRTATDLDPSDWEDLDSILHRLGRTWSQPLDADGNPEEVMMRRELLQTITGMLHCLSTRERRIVESHFFDHLQPHEIARLFQMSQANVYQVLSRSRKKLVQEKTRVVVDQYVNARKDARKMTKAVLNKPEAFTLPTWITCGMALYGMAAYTERKMSLPMVLGLSGHAFRLTVVPEEIHISGPTMFDFGAVLQQGLRNMGFTSRAVSERISAADMGPNANLVNPSLLSPEARAKRQLPQLLPQALEVIHRSIDRGYPVLSWDLFIPEFGLIYGYDDEQRLLHAGDNCGHDQTIPYEHLGRGLIEELFVLAIDETVDVDPRTMLTGAIRMALAHYRGEEEGCGGSISGLAAYAAWQEAFQKGTIEPNGNAYTTAVAHNARQSASLFWDEIADTWTDPAFDEIRPTIREAADLYRQMAETYAELCRLFPFPAGGEPNDPTQGRRTVEFLQSIEKQERQAVALLENMQAGLSA